MTNVENETKNVTIELEINEVNVVLAALQELPHRVADPILKRIFEQVQPQLQPQLQAPSAE